MSEYNFMKFKLNNGPNEQESIICDFSEILGFPIGIVLIIFGYIIDN
jgi:hypothetical protein